LKNASDILVIGGGTIGLSTAYHAARRGLNVTLLDRFPVPGNEGPNDYGSTTRKGIFERRGG